jgi:EpsG family
MVVYWLLFILPVIGTIYSLEPRLSGLPYLREIFYIFVAFAIGMRYEVGGDWFAYVDYSNLMKESTLETSISMTNPGYFFLNWFFAKIGLGIVGVNLFCGLLFTHGLDRFAEQQPYPWFARAISVPYLLIVVAMGYSKQGVAIGFILLSLVNLKKGKLHLAFISMIAAALFHATALFLTFLFFFYFKGNIFFRLMATATIIISLLAALLSSSLDQQLESYIGQSMHSEGGAIRLYLQAVPSIIYLALSGQLKGYTDHKIWISFSILSLFLIPLSSFGSTAADRFALYFLPLQLIAYPRLASLISYSAERATFIIGTLGFYGFILYVWLHFAVNSMYWVPYKFYLHN